MSLKNRNNPNSPGQPDNTIAQLKEILDVWHFTANWMTRFTVIFGISAIVSSVLVSVYTSTHILTDSAIKVLACISTASLTLLTAFNVVKKGNNARQAWRILNAGLFKYEAGVYNMEELIHIYEIGEKIVGDVDFSYGTPGKPTDDAEYENKKKKKKSSTI